MPRVSIGLPVYNGENYISEALRSIVDQTYFDFEVIVCDNCSTDCTAEIARALAKEDARIRYVCNKKNLGAAPNFNRCVDLATGEYFKWAAHDDYLGETYLEFCVDKLDGRPDAVLCHSSSVIVNEQSQHVRDYSLENGLFDKPDAIERFRKVILAPHGCLSVFGVIRRDVLLSTRMIDSFNGSDRNLLAELSLRGTLVHVEEPLFFSRDHSERSIRRIDLYDRNEWYDTKTRGSVSWRFCGMFFRHFRAIFDAPLTLGQVLRASIVMAAWLGKNWRKMLGEVMRNSRSKLRRSHA